MPSTATARSPEDKKVPLPGSVAGRRIVRLQIPSEKFQPHGPPAGLFVALGFEREGENWRYDRTRALEWFIAQLRARTDYSWAQGPWSGPEPTAGTPTSLAQPQAGPAPSGGGGGGGGGTGGTGRPPTRTR